jgi:uncharacterized protein YqgC (DUF456 family)
VEAVLAVIGWICYALALVAGLLLDFVGLFGNWLILGATAVAWLATGREHFSLWGLGVMLLFAILGEALEAVFAAFGARRFGGTRGTGVSAIIGAFAGAIFGSPLMPVVGTLIGACAGAFVAALLYELLRMRKQLGQAAWTGLGAAIGRILGVFGKLFAGVMMLVAAALSF